MQRFLGQQSILIRFTSAMPLSNGREDCSYPPLDSIILKVQYEIVVLIPEVCNLLGNAFSQLTPDFQTQLAYLGIYSYTWYPYPNLRT